MVSYRDVKENVLFINFHLNIIFLLAFLVVTRWHVISPKLIFVSKIVLHFSLLFFITNLYKQMYLAESLNPLFKMYFCTS